MAARRVLTPRQHAKLQHLVQSSCDLWYVSVATQNDGSGGLSSTANEHPAMRQAIGMVFDKIQLNCCWQTIILWVVGV
ncbi:hypothetical protein C2845_PM12G06370 [Panicum miliaceum]|uniref:Uncharacterized protein n=1 Tax=Panicum miliaceum TaxID=4540 RepID=A0A3L6QI62_PANMI|nr:hypothetical protein C2845_PM12G06370 [Panicum miliaceum]